MTERLTPSSVIRRIHAAREATRNTVSIGFHPVTADRIRALAKADHMSFGQKVRELVALGLAAVEEARR